MPRNTYSAKTKAAIIAAVSNARKAGKTWAEALEDAKKTGYAGSLQGITKMMRAVAKKTGKPARKRRGRKANSKAAVNMATGIVKRGPGRPPKTAAGVGGIEAMVEKIVCERVAGVLDHAIAMLRDAR